MEETTRNEVEVMDEVNENSETEQPTSGGTGSLIGFGLLAAVAGITFLVLRRKKAKRQGEPTEQHEDVVDEPTTDVRATEDVVEPEA